MRRIIADQLTFLRDFDESTYREVKAVSQDLGSGVIAVDDSKLRIAFRNSFFEWLDAMGEEEPSVPTTPAPVPAPAPVSTADEDLARLQQQREQEAAQAKAVEDATNARVAFYISVQGLLDNDVNRDLLFDWFEKNKAAYTAHNVDRAIEGLAVQLQWAVWAPRLQPVEEVRTFPNGEPELPLNASPDVIRRASKEQVADLSRRKGEFTAHRRGSFGASFIKPTF